MVNNFRAKLSNLLAVWAIRLQGQANNIFDVFGEISVGEQKLRDSVASMAIDCGDADIMRHCFVLRQEVDLVELAGLSIEVGYNSYRYAQPIVGGWIEKRGVQVPGSRQHSVTT